MPQIRVLYWNIETFGLQNGYRNARQPYCQLIAIAAHLAQADVLVIQEVRSWAVFNYTLQELQQTLNALLPAPNNNWHYDYIKGAVDFNGVAPYATSNDLMWDAAHYEGYAVFWNQNIAKFTMTPAPPIQAPGPPPGPVIANTQSETVRMQGAFMLFGAAQPLPGQAIPGGGITVPALANPYVVPAGTIVPGNPATPAPAGAAPGVLLPIGTVIGPAGITLANAVNGVNPVVVPGNFTLTDPLTLPAVGTVVVPQHAASLVLFGRNTGNPPSTGVGDISGGVQNFAPAGVNNWDWLLFTRGGGFPAVGPGARRPVYVILDVNRQAPVNGPADRLVPVIGYHAPSAPAAAASGMQRAAYSRPLYQAYDPTAAGWIDCNNAMLGGDFNIAIDTTQYPYNAFTNAFAAGGANCAIAIANPALPPPPAGQTRADNPLNKTMVLIDNWGVPVFSANPDGFRVLAIDNVFYRGFAGGAAGARGDLLTGVIAGGGLPAPAITAFLAQPTLAAAAAAIVGGMGLPLAPNINALVSTVTDVQAGAFGNVPNFGNDTAARRAAEFVNLFISDHLPVGLAVLL